MVRNLSIVVAAIASLLSNASGLSAVASLPNVVLIIGDDQAWSDFGFMGNREVRTPHLDRLASQSAFFPRAYVPTSLCRPSLATIISGQYPHQHRITGNDPPKGTERREMLRHIRRIPTLPRLLGEKGYVSLQTGKWWEGGFAEGGFTAGMTHGEPSRGGRHGDEGLKIGREGLQPVFDFLDTAAGKPFFLWYAPFLPHTPHNPPARLLEKYHDSKQPDYMLRYYAMCEWFDETCGELLGEIDRRGLTENTLVLFVTDNGWIAPPRKPGERATVPFAPRSKNSPYEGGIRSPILVRWPGRVAPGRYEALASSIDIAPTILAATGMKPTVEMTGIDLIDLVRKGGESGRDTLFGELYAHDVGHIDDPLPGLRHRWVVRNQWKSIFPVQKGAQPELYDVLADPHERTNRAGENGAIVAEHRELLEEWWRQTAAPLPAIDAPR